MEAAQIGQKAVDISVAASTWELFGFPGPPRRGFFENLFNPGWKHELHDRFRVEIIGFVLASFESMTPELADEVDKAINLICVNSRSLAWTNKRVEYSELRNVVSKYASRKSTDRIEAMHIRLGGMRELSHEERFALRDGAREFDGMIYSDANREAASRIR